METQRKYIVTIIEEACQQGARQTSACDIVGITVRTLQRWLKADTLQDQRLERQFTPANKLSEMERRQVLHIVNEAEFADLPPSKIVPLLADKGRYIASESTFYRILKADQQLTHRQRCRPANDANKPMALVAVKPNEIYSWDITYLPTTVKGVFLYLYFMLDVYSRKIVGWQVHDCECAEHASHLLTDVCEREGVSKEQVTLHSDNGSPMKAATMLATLQQLGVIPSFSRPSVSNDNPYSESLFKTLKYRPDYPLECFANLDKARTWVEGFVDWYNNEHLHSGIQFVTPAQRHRGEDRQILAKRHELYLQARAKKPCRWSKSTRNWQPVTRVFLNPDKANQQPKQTNRAA